MRFGITASKTAEIKTCLVFAIVAQPGTVFSVYKVVNLVVSARKKLYPGVPLPQQDQLGSDRLMLSAGVQKDRFVFV